MKRKSNTKAKKPISKSTIWIRAGIVVGIGAIFAMGFYLYLIIAGQQLLKENVSMLGNTETSILYDAKGDEFKRLYRQNRDEVEPGQIPNLVRNAFIAVEDKRFEDHSGVDFLGIARAVMVDIIHRSAKQGGSTITQQLAKNLYLTQEKTLFRKAKEVSIAVALESRYSKDQILTMYLNTIYFGESAYGIKSASKTYFNKSDLNDLTIAEAALLAGLPKAPSAYNPIDYPERALARRTVVLELMKNEGYITEEEQAQALATTYKAPEMRSSTEAYWGFIDYVFQEAEVKVNLTPEQLYANGYKIYTTMNVKAQNQLEQTFGNPALFPQTPNSSDPIQAAAVIMDHSNGGIVAMLGGRDYRPRSYNRAVQRRQPGSSFKPIIAYAPAIESGKYNPKSMLVDEQKAFGDYKPRNYNGIYKGKVTMTEAIQSSINIPAVWLLNEIGVKTGMNFAESMGISLDSKSDRNLAIALGGLTNGVSPLKMAQAYSAFANLGTWQEAYAIRKIVDREGNILYENEVNKKRVMSEKSAYWMTEMLQTVVQSGTGQSAKMGRPVAGKTGTTQVNVAGAPSNANRDAWFVGYTPEWTAAIWMGFDRTTSKNYMISGSSATARIFSNVMSGALQGTKSKSFAKPANVDSMVSEDLETPSNVNGVYKQALNSVFVSWSAVSNAEKYNVYRRATNESEFTILESTVGLEIIDNRIVSETDYEYYVVAIKGDKIESAPSSTIFVSIPLTDSEVDPNLVPIESPSTNSGQPSNETVSPAPSATN